MPITLKDKYQSYQNRIYDYMSNYSRLFYRESLNSEWLNAGFKIVEEHPRYKPILIELHSKNPKEVNMCIWDINVEDMEFDYFKEKFDKIIAIWQLQRT